MKTALITAALLGAASSALAQAPPGGGAQLRQIPPAAAQPKSLPDLRVDRPRSASGQPGDAEVVHVSALRVTGNTVFAEPQLLAAAQFPVGRDATLGELRAAAARIAGYYNDRGYFLTQAYLPAQEIDNGSVTVAVVEGRYDKITLRNDTKVAERVPAGILRGLRTGDIVANAPLERRLLLLSDLPGVAVRSTLTPGTAIGATDLIVGMTPGRRVTGVIDGDNGGNRYTGEYRAGGTVNFNEPFGQGDVASLRVLASNGGLFYGRGSYEAQVEDGRLGVAYARLGYKLGHEFKPLDATGTASIASVYGSYPLIRTYRGSLYARVDADRKGFRDAVGATGSVTNRSANLLNVGLSGDFQDRVGAGGRTSFAVTAGFGDLDIKTPATRAIDAVTARSNGGYSKLNLEVTRLQAVTQRVSIYMAFAGQLASKNLDSSEKMELGGPYGVRAYPEGEAYGDEGYIATLEARYLLSESFLETGGRVQLSAFVDTGQVTTNKNAWAAGPNHRSLSGAGVGATWSDTHNFVVRASYARKLGDGRATSAPDRSGRLWVQLSKFF